VFDIADMVCAKEGYERAYEKTGGGVELIEDDF